MKKLVLSFALVALLFGNGEDDFGEDDFGEDFNQKTILPNEDNYLDDILRGFSYSGKVSWLSAYNYIEGIQTLSSFKLSADLDVEYKINKNHKIIANAKAYHDDIYSLNNIDDSNIPDTYEQESELGEAYIAGTINNNMDYKIGRQIVVWGKSDSLRVSDILNPLDNRNPAITDIEDLRLPVGMIRLDWYYDDWNFGAIDIYEQRFSKLPKYGSGYISTKLPAIVMPKDKQQIAFYANGRFNGWDLSLYAADKYNDKFYLDLNQTGKTILKELKFNKIQMLGSSINIVKGAFLLKAEAAFLKGVQYSDTIKTGTTSLKIISHDVKDVLNSLVGVDYSISNGSLSFEISNSYIYDYESSMADSLLKQKEDTLTYSARYSQSFLHESLSLNSLVTIQGIELEDGGFVRAWINYKQSDNFSYDVGIVEYIGGESFFYDGMSDSDKVFINGRYSF